MPLKGFCGVGADWVRRTIPNPEILSVNCFMSRSEIEAVDAVDFAESDIVLVSASQTWFAAVSLLGNMDYRAKSVQRKRNEEDE